MWRKFEERERTSSISGFQGMLGLHVFVKKHLSGFVNPPECPGFTCLMWEEAVESKAPGKLSKLAAPEESRNLAEYLMPF